jgi:ABC-type amino acid transport system permease subunit
MPAHLETPMENVPLTLRDAVFACALGIALGALVAIGL